MTDYLRSDWTAYPDIVFSPMGQAIGVAIHHTASTPLGLHYDPEYLRILEQGEKNQGFNALAYHRMGFDNGDTAESRPDFNKGAATGGHNDDTVALCAVGYFHPPHNHVPSDALVQSFARIIKGWRDRGVITPTAIVKPHSWWTAGTQWATACCGNGFIPRVAEIEALSYESQNEEVPDDMWGVYYGLFDGRVEYAFGIGACVQWTVAGQPQPPYGLPMNEINYVKHTFPANVRMINTMAGFGLQAATLQLTGAKTLDAFRP